MKFPVFLGRDESNDVILPDPLKIISRKHAKIIETEGIFQLVDLGSANFTYLNEQRIQPNEENPIKSGDKIKIGEYELVIQLIIEKEHTIASQIDDQKTRVFSNPYKEEIDLFADNLKAISEKYLLDNSNLKSEALKFSILQGLGGIEKNDVNKIIAEFFIENFSDKDFYQGDSKENKNISQNIVEDFSPKKVQPEFKPPVSENISHLTKDYSLTSHFTETIDVLLETFSKLIHGFLQFRQEFFGVTVYYTMPTGSLKELKEYLFNPAISPEEEKKRLNLLKEETQKLLSHQIGLLEGYMSSVTEGSKSLLESLNPEKIEAEIEKKSKNSPGLDLGKILPAARKSKILDIIKENYKKYISDPYHIEKKFFRPTFMKGYQKRISAKPKNEF